LLLNREAELVDRKRVEELAKKARAKLNEAASKRETAGPMGMQPKREGDIISASDPRRDAPGADRPTARP
jgi:hypothetical protein